MPLERKVRYRYVRFLAGYGAASIVCAWAVWHIGRRNDRAIQDPDRDAGIDHGPDEPIRTGDGARADRRSGATNGIGLGAQWIYTATVLGWLCVLTFASWWNPTTWWGSVGGTVTRTIDDLKKLVKDAISSAITIVERAVDRGFHDVAHTFDVVRHDTATTFDGVRHDIAVGADALRHDIASAVHGAEVLAYAGIKAAESKVDGVYLTLLHDLDVLRHDVASGADSAVRDLIDPLTKWIDGADRWLVAHLAHWWDATYRDVIKPIVTDAQDAYRWAETLWHWYSHVALDIVTVCVKALDWLEWFALHPFTAIHDSLLSIEDTFSLSSIESEFDGASDYVDTLAEKFGRLLT